MEIMYSVLDSCDHMLNPIRKITIAVLGHLVGTGMSKSVFCLPAISGTMSVSQPHYVPDTIGSSAPWMWLMAVVAFLTRVRLASRHYSRAESMIARPLRAHGVRSSKLMGSMGMNSIYVVGTTLNTTEAGDNPVTL